MPILKVDDLSVSRSGKLVIHGINLEVFKGEFIGLVGPNGSGKSTLLLAILGVLKAQHGTISLYGHRPMSRNILGKIGWVSQAAAVMPKNVRITVRELIQLGTLTSRNMFFPRKAIHRERVENAIRMVGLEDVADNDIVHLVGPQHLKLQDDCGSGFLDISFGKVPLKERGNGSETEVTAESRRGEGARGQGGRDLERGEARRGRS